MSLKNYFEKMQESFESVRAPLTQVGESLRSAAWHLEIGEQTSSSLTFAQNFFSNLDTSCANLFGDPEIQPNFNFLNASDETVIEIAKYLNPHEICSLLATSKRAFLLVCHGDTVIWENHLLHSFGISYHPNVCNSSREMYLKCKLDVLHSAISHYESVKNAHPCLNKFYKMFPEFCMQLADFGCVKDEKLARVLSRKRHYAMGTMLVKSSVDIMTFKKAHKLGAPQNFLSLDVCHSETFSKETVLQNLPCIDFPGLIDYAIHLIELREEHEKYRYSVLYTFYKNLMVFETKRDIEEFSVVYGGIPYAVALDSFTEEELNVPFPKFSWSGFRDNIAMYEPEFFEEMLNKKLSNTQQSLAHLRYSSMI